MFLISDKNLNRDELHETLSNHKAGAIVVFEGWVRNHNEGKQVLSLEYQVYKELALKEGERILEEARKKFNLHAVMSVHREGHLALGDIAIWIGATASHRDDAFKATRYIIDEIKHRLPVWKKEHYINEKPEWVICRHQHHHVNFKESDYYQKQTQMVDQYALKNSKVLVIGAGGLGCPVLVNLATAGVGSISIVDFDQISISNIHRQFLFTPHLVGEKKALIAAKKISEVNPFIEVNAIVDHFKEEHIRDHDLILDCTDNMQTKYQIHDACFKHKVPLISAGIYKSEGQIRTFIPAKGCLRCFVIETPDDSLLGNCNDFGVLGATTSIIGSLQASEAIEFLNRGNNASFESTLHFNVKTHSVLKVKNTVRKDCPVCQGHVVTASHQMEITDLIDGKLIDIRHMTDEEVLSLNTNEKLILYCHKGIRSLKMVRDLRQRGFKEVYSLRGGVERLDMTASCHTHGHHHHHS